ncbi:SubName: Full=Uncharacterized protein {ECO:0000313/EMBL:CCA75119.1} [Serendipita indica DSM 11827]|uniref:ATPase inhibitor, mitochondrial n=1 Tax=Serendipita indica (strain DSM 11827) TaxID=1109443 RepID=G4TUX6_SERID|nr:SubName: Full=Uncharacterized protein {ECO:0000313/EMBL:CCA75119.1} [Serendipita indica DSM 11827]CCA75119.1 hypothetical protein PIIN_09103 [Serendipita indica DSM 11827]
MSAVVRRAVPAFAALRTRTVAAVGTRMYSDGSGATARDPGWSKKEKAVEDQYAHNREVEAMNKLRQQLEAKEKELNEREKNLEQREKKGSS